jgi:hypothetical protein
MVCKNLLMPLNAISESQSFARPLATYNNCKKMLSVTLFRDHPAYGSDLTLKMQTERVSIEIA